jgi:hypothetical protein
MKRILRFLWTGQWKECEHEWVVLNTYDVSFFGYPQPKEYDLQCEKCGIIKHI